jgi:hypothetical protein
MINFYNQVPSVYPSASRDFQYLSWLINIVLNSVKHNVDDLYDLPKTNADPKIAELLALTLGFKIKRNYDQKQLAALVAILPSILRYKGTINAVKMAAEALLTAAGSLGDTECTEDDTGTQLEVVLPKDLVDTTLFMDLLDYILPAGMTCRIIRQTQKKQPLDNIHVRHSDFVQYEVHDDLGWDNAAGTGTGLATLFDTTQGAPEVTANFKAFGDVLNTGLLNNTVIPVLRDAELLPVPDSPAVDDNLVALRSRDNKLLLDKSGKRLMALRSK